MVTACFTLQAEAAHAAALKEEQRERERLAQQLREKEQDFHNQMEKIRTAEAFRVSLTSS